MGVLGGRFVSFMRKTKPESKPEPEDPLLSLPFPPENPDGFEDNNPENNRGSRVIDMR